MLTAQTWQITVGKKLPLIGEAALLEFQFVAGHSNSNPTEYDMHLSITIFGVHAAPAATNSQPLIEHRGQGGIAQGKIKWVVVVVLVVVVVTVSVVVVDLVAVAEEVVVVVVLAAVTVVVFVSVDVRTVDALLGVVAAVVIRCLEVDEVLGAIVVVSVVVVVVSAQVEGAMSAFQFVVGQE